MEQVDRNEAVILICRTRLSLLNEKDRESYILDWWAIDSADDEFSLLSSELRNLILENEEPPGDLESKKYDELIFIGLIAEYKGVRNTFLAKILSDYGMGMYEVFGEVERLEVCPCCKYRTLSSRGEYEICGLCNWEDNGIEVIDQYSGPNHMTLREARDRFNKNLKKLPEDKWVKA